MILDGVEISEIGRTDDACPHCGVIFEPRPARKVSCRSCGAAVHVRKRPIDDVKVLVTPAELGLLEQQWTAFMDLKSIVRMLAYDSAEAAAVFKDLDEGRRGRTPIDWGQLEAIAAKSGQMALLKVRARP